MLLDKVARTSAVVAAAPGRLAKVAEIAGLLREVPQAEVPAVVAFLSGELTQRQIGVGYAAIMDLLGPAGSAGLAAPPETPTLTVTEADEAFGAIGAQAGPGSQAERRQLLRGLLARATESERQFLVRLLAGELGQGALAGVMTEAVAAAAGVPAAAVRRAFQVGGSLTRAATAALGQAGDPARAQAALLAVLLQVGQPVRPMLAATAPTIEAALEKISPAAVEWKIDGIRIQVHRDGDQIRVFTRTLDDITARVPEIVAAARSLIATSAVVDGEAVALRPDGRPRPFQVTSARTASQGDAGRLAEQTPLTPFLFDLLHLDGADLLDAPASERFGRLAAIAPAGLVIPRIVTAEPAAAAEFFAAAIGHGHEGVVIKSLDAPYGAGRRGGDWVKVKPRHTLDLVVLAAEWGHGRRQGWLSNLHLGARDPATGGMVMLGKTFKGLTDALLAWQTSRLLELADPPRPGAAGRDSPGADPAGWRGVVRVRPELVAEIAFDGVQASTRYPGGVTLRFARVLRYREDKSAAEADTIDAVRALWSGGEPD
ncbi:MAG TPA: ATP-dependent DNA ligase [Streptosporangiaceae bacterium]|nr:ATP-dependent DNA ligase [Streptosporangiaceae bacterium]